MSLKIAHNIKEVNGKVVINDIAKNLLIKRARLVAGASNKLVVLRNLMGNYSNKNYILVYCQTDKKIDNEIELQMNLMVVKKDKLEEYVKYFGMNLV